MKKLCFCVALLFPLIGAMGEIKMPEYTSYQALLEVDGKKTTATIAIMDAFATVTFMAAEDRWAREATVWLLLEDGTALKPSSPPVGYQFGNSAAGSEFPTNIMRLFAKPKDAKIVAIAMKANQSLSISEISPIKTAP